MKTLKKLFASCLIVFMTLTAAPLQSFVGFDLPIFSDAFLVDAEASSDSLTDIFSGYEWQQLLLTNRERIKEGLNPLTSNYLMQKACDIRANEIDALFSHDRPDGSSCFTVLGDVSAPAYSRAGENIAAGYRSPEDVTEGWMNSEGHKRNILNSDFVHMGMGYCYGDGYYSYYWVQLFHTSFNCSYDSELSLTLPQTMTFEKGTSVDDMHITAKIHCKTCGDCYIPVMSEFCAGYDSDATGTQTIKVSCLGKQTEFDVNIEEPVTLSSISVYTKPSKTSYYIGDTLSTSGLKLKLTYSDGTTEYVTSGFTTSGFSSTSAGTKTVTVSYEGKTTTFTVTVNTPTITLSSSSKTLETGKSATLTATTTPSGQSVTWTSSNTSVATVSGGTVTAKAKGTATITAKFTYNGKTYSKTCTVTVECAHQNTLSVPYVASTCVTQGNEAYTVCNDCGKIISGTDEKLPLKSHSYTSKVTTAASCTKEGVKTYTCSCGDSYTERIAKTSHSYSVKNTGKTYLKSAATCTDAAIYYYSCTCGAKGTKSFTSGDALGHSWSAWETVTAADCTKTGKQTRECTRCDETESKTIAKKAHTIVTTEGKGASCVATGLTDGKKCSVCGTVTVKQSVIAKEPHTYETTTTKATTSTDGKAVNACTSCGDVKSTTKIYKASSFKLSETEYTYDGKEKKPSVTVKDSKGNTLKNGTDYTVKYESGRKNVGEYTVTVTLKGNYSGEKKLTFTIAPKATGKITVSQTTSTITAKWSKVDGATGYKVYIYNGTKKVASKTVDSKTTSCTFKSLTAGTKYTVKVKTCKKVDGETYESAFKTLETATKTKTPKITVTAGSKKATVKWDDVSGESGYQVYYATSKKGAYKKGVTCKANDIDATIKNLTKGKTYYFKVRAYTKTDSGTVYSAWSAVKSVKVK